MCLKNSKSALIIPHGTFISQLLGNRHVIFGPIARTGSFMISLFGLDITEYLFEVTSFHFAKNFVGVESVGSVIKLEDQGSVEVGSLGPVGDLEGGRVISIQNDVQLRNDTAAGN